jgi:hypothetical protein
MQSRLDMFVNGHVSRKNYLSFLTTINMAFYAAIFYSRKNSIWELYPTGLCLVLFLIFINVILSIVYYREERHDRILDANLKEFFFKAKGASKALKKFQNKYESEQGIWKGKSSLLTNLLLSVLIALPTAYVFASYEHLMLLIKAMGCKFTMFLFIFFSVTLLLVIASLIDLPKNYLRELNFKK